MGLFGALDAASSGATLGQTWLDASSDNIANADTVRPAGQQPYRAKEVVAASLPGTQGVSVVGFTSAAGAPEVSYDPENPLADSAGYVTHPKVDMTEEMTNVMVAQRLYQANLSVVQQAKDTYTAALKIGQ